MATEAEIKAECRLYALEWAVSQVWAMLLKTNGAGPEVLELIRQTAIDGARKKTFAGADPAMSDLLSAELEIAVDRILKMPIELLGPSSKTPGL